MENTTHSYKKIAAVALFVTVATQILYLALLTDVDTVEGWPTRSIIWTVETLSFTALAVAAFAAMTQNGNNRLIFSAIAVSGLFNALQAGIGLSMFLPPAEAGEAGELLGQTVLIAAFLFYFLAKVLTGFAGILLGLSMFRSGTGAVKLVGIVTVLISVPAMLINIYAMPSGFDLSVLLPAGASGTLATLFLAISIWMGAKD